MNLLSVSEAKLLFVISIVLETQFCPILGEKISVKTNLGFEYAIFSSVIEDKTCMHYCSCRISIRYWLCNLIEIYWKLLKWEKYPFWNHHGIEVDRLSFSCVQCVFFILLCVECIISIKFWVQIVEYRTVNVYFWIILCMQ